VREVHLLGKWSDATSSFVMPRSATGVLKSAILVQDGPGGAILSARRI